MRSDWDARARENARWYIATNDASDDDATFIARAHQDMDKFFLGIESTLHDQQDVLDLGCGIGRLEEVLAPRVRSILGIDISGEMIRQAQDRCAHLENVRFAQNDGLGLSDVPDASVGMFMSYVVFQHIPRWAVVNYLTEARRVLRPGGEFVVQLVSWRSPDVPLPPDDETFQIRFYSEPEVLGMLNALGFEDTVITPDPESKPEELHLGIRVHARVPDDQ